MVEELPNDSSCLLYGLRLSSHLCIYARALQAPRKLLWARHEGFDVCRVQYDADSLYVQKRVLVLALGACLGIRIMDHKQYSISMNNIVFVLSLQ